MVDTFRVVDVDGDVLGPAELDGEHLDVGQPVLNGLGDLAVELAFLLVNLGHLFCAFSQKMGAARPLLQLEMWFQTG